MKFEGMYLAAELESLVEAAIAYPELKVMIACGGWGGSGGFSDMVLTQSSRAIFINSVVDFVKEYELDGVDLDWEYPGLPGTGNTHRPEDRENFTALVTEFRIALNEVRPNMLITFAAAGWEKYFDFIELRAEMEQVDYMNIMTYDMAGGNQRTSHHTALYSASDSINTSRSADAIIQFCIDKGVNPEQIVIGAAFYGRSWSGVSTADNGLYQSFSGSKSIYAYSKLRSMMKEDTAYSRHWDAQASAPYIFNLQDSIFLSYDDPESLNLKSRYVKEHKLGGIMFWQLIHDNEDHELVHSIYLDIKKTDSETEDV